MSIVNTMIIAKAVAAMLNDDSTVQSLLSPSSKEVRVNPYVNVDPNFASWVGVYNRRSTLTPSSIPGTFDTKVKMSVVVQATDISDISCATKLDELLNAVLACIVRDLKLRTTVDFVELMDIEYTYIPSDQESLYFQMAVAEIVARAKSSN